MAVIDDGFRRWMGLLVLVGAGCAHPAQSQNVDRPVVGEHASGSPAFLVSAPRPYAPQCAIFQPCDAPKLAGCDVGHAPSTTVAALHGSAAAVAGPLRLAGVLELNSRICTDGSPPAECGDECTADFKLTDGATTIELVGPTCRGDDSGVCCPFPFGTSAIVQGTHRIQKETGRHWLIVESVCAR